MDILLYLLYNDYILPILNFNHMLRVDIPDRNYRCDRKKDYAEKSNIFTDGSKTKEGVDAAVYCKNLNLNLSPDSLTNVVFPASNWRGIHENALVEEI